MPAAFKQIEESIARIEEIISKLQVEVEKRRQELQEIDPAWRQSAANLIHYINFRKFNLTQLQGQLRVIGITGYSHAEGHVMWTLKHSKFLLESILGRGTKPEEDSGLSIDRSREILRHHTAQLLGPDHHSRRVRIMVTLPTEAAYYPELVGEILRAGTDVVRINCAHDGEEVWLKMIGHVKREAAALGREVRIAMDLGGPKIRTGHLEPGLRVKKFSPKKDEGGHVIKPATVMLKRKIEPDSPANVLPVSVRLLEHLKVGDKVKFKDERGKERELEVAEVLPGTVKTYLYKTSYIRTGIALHARDGVVSDVGEMPHSEKPLLLKQGHQLWLTGPEEVGRNAVFGWDRSLKYPAKIPCQMPQVFKSLKAGHRIMFDDGKIEGVIREVYPDKVLTEITRAREKGSLLKSEKGINFPDSELEISGLTQKDRSDLKFIATHADVVNFSFVNAARDVEDLLAELEQLGATDRLGIILKIETGKAYDRLSEIVFAAMKKRGIGVMIARGDLAVETGWENMGLVQEEILALCGAAHIPVIWATQVLENLAKKGIPSRSEITDVTNSLKAECVMLNKGPYILDAITMLDKILKEAEKFRLKKERMLPGME